MKIYNSVTDSSLSYISVCYYIIFPFALAPVPNTDYTIL